MRKLNGKLIVEKHWLLFAILHGLINALQKFVYSNAAVSPQLTF